MAEFVRPKDTNLAIPGASITPIASNNDSAGYVGLRKNVGHRLTRASAVMRR